jgi:N-acetyl sugar amidotransferase
MKNVIWCKNCILPNTRPNITINSLGICNACLNYNKKNHINWENRFKTLKEIVRQAKRKSNNRFDCLIPVSGGKDSTWQTYHCLKLGMKPLAFTWKSPSQTLIGKKNLDNLIKLGVDHVNWTINPELEKKFILANYKKFGSTAVTMHLGIHNISRYIASNFKIPLIVWGENSALEYGHNSEEDTNFYISKNWRKFYGVTHNTSIVDWVGKEFSEQDLFSFFPKNSKENFLEIFLGNFINWDPIKVYNFSKRIGFDNDINARTGIYNFADIDDDFISIHHWMKWYKFGFNRAFDNLSIEIRNRRISRDKAIEIIKSKNNFLPSNDIKKFCKYTNITLNNFFKIAEKFRNKNIWYKDKGLWKIRNFLIENWNWKKSS